MGWTGIGGRVATLAGAAAICGSVAGRAWWTFVGGNEIFTDQTGTIGPHLATWCSGVFCHDLSFMMSTEVGGLFVGLGTALYYTGLCAALFLAILAIAPRRPVKGLSGATLAIVAITAGLAVAAFATVGSPRSHAAPPRVLTMGLGFPLVMAGAVLGTLGGLIIRRDPGGPGFRVWPRLGWWFYLAAGPLVLLAVLTQSWWHWTWSDERVIVGLREATKCWERAGTETICSTAEPPLEAFMADREEPSVFRDMSTRTYYAGLVGVAMLFASVLVPAWRRRSQRGLPGLPYVVTLLFGWATLLATPDPGPARDVQVGWGFPMLAIACVLGMLGGVLIGRSDETERAPVQ